MDKMINIIFKKAVNVETYINPANLFTLHLLR